MRTTVLTVAASVACGISIAADGPSIIQGFGETKWGQSRQEVAALVPVSPDKPTHVDRSGIPNIVAECPHLTFSRGISGSSVSDGRGGVCSAPRWSVAGRR